MKELRFPRETISNVELHRILVEMGRPYVVATRFTRTEYIVLVIL